MYVITNKQFLVKGLTADIYWFADRANIMKDEVDNLGEVDEVISSHVGMSLMEWCLHMSPFMRFPWVVTRVLK